MLLLETFPLIVSLEEAESSGGEYRLKGLFHLAETKNANGRIYPKKLLEREVKRIASAIKSRQVIGELDHPDQPAIKLDRVSHIITDIKMDGNSVYGTLETTKTEKGRELKGLIESGIKLGISSRGVGSLKEDSNAGASIVQDDYELLTWDVVPNPSTPEAWLGENKNPSFFNSAEKNEINKIISEGNDTDFALYDRITELFGGK